ncbi:Piezo-type mechanosensitive ion channel component 1 [Saguinus oedipus]|uniref:Piezo-type mechanosensitive ion channel component 1 n=1 Tax=Saguinus oedipus TaxID=9490 RepID=A0ABQ9TMA4_SAGOE|nr:Piezo-type mechanosensitive ion channel component 1 [Saguinus oedipus]
MDQSYVSALIAMMVGGHGGQAGVGHHLGGLREQLCSPLCCTGVVATGGGQVWDTAWVGCGGGSAAPSAAQVWSITYHSWLTFVLLLWACLIWTVRSRHQLAMLCSPCILLYGMTLCCLRYVWAMDLRPELPTTLGPVSLRQLGLEHTRYPCLDLGAMRRWPRLTGTLLLVMGEALAPADWHPDLWQLLYTLTFWLLLRQFVKEKLLKSAEALAVLTEVTVADTGECWDRVGGCPPARPDAIAGLLVWPTEPTRTQMLLHSLGELVKDVYAKYWIYVCAGMFIVVSFAGRLVVYKIVYMFLFLLCLTLFQVYYSLWRKLLKAFWWLVVAYTMLVLIAVYTFQFQDFPAYWRNLTGFTDQQLGDLGLEQFSVSELFSSILVPGFFLLACILQLHYFHGSFMQLTDMEHVAQPGTRLRPWTHRCGRRLRGVQPPGPGRELGDSDTGHGLHVRILTGICSCCGAGVAWRSRGPNVSCSGGGAGGGFFQLWEMRGAGTQLGGDIVGPSPRQDAASGTPLLQQQPQEEDEGPRDKGLGTDMPHQAMQVPEAPAAPTITGTAKWGLVAERLLELAAGFSDVLSRVQVFLRRLLELHVFKLVALYTVWVALKEVSVMNLLLVVLWAFALPYPRFRPMASCLSTVWTCVVIVCKMLYQLKVVNPQDYSSNCTEVPAPLAVFEVPPSLGGRFKAAGPAVEPSPNSTNLLTTEISQSLLYRGPVDPANWFGVRKGFPNLGYIQNHLQVLLLLVFEAIVYRGQEYYRRQHQLAPLPAQAVFASGTRQQLDQDLLSCFKYFTNFFFYKFGLEICFLMAVNVIGQRMNFMVTLHGCWLVVILTRRRRQAIARLWPNYCLFLALFLLYQYLLCLGMPPALCIGKLWESSLGPTRGNRDASHPSAALSMGPLTANVPEPTAPTHGPSPDGVTVQRVLWIEAAPASASPLRRSGFEIGSGLMLALDLLWRMLGGVAGALSLDWCGCPGVEGLFQVHSALRSEAAESPLCVPPALRWHPACRHRRAVRGRPATASGKSSVVSVHPSAGFPVKESGHFSLASAAPGRPLGCADPGSPGDTRSRCPGSSPRPLEPCPRAPALSSSQAH